MTCKFCGQETADPNTCEHCGKPMAEPVIAPEAPAETPKKPENVTTGIVGAVLGACLGAGSILLFSQLGYVSAISGFILAVCTLKGYELLGNQLSKTGIIVSIVLMALTPYIADRLDWAIVILNQAQSEGLNWTFANAFQAIPLLMEEEVIEAGSYWSNLGMLYLFTALGAFGTLKGLFVKK